MNTCGTPSFTTYALSILRRQSVRPDQNQARRRALAAVRGFGTGQALFTGFPDQVDWVHLALTLDELGELRYLDCRAWRDLSGPSLLVRDGAANVDLANRVNEKVRGIEEALENGETYPEIIVVAEARMKPLIVLEGHGRATAYCRIRPQVDEFMVIAGHAPGIEEWGRRQWY